MRKLPTRARKETTDLVLNIRPESPRKLDLYKKHGGVYTMHNTRDCGIIRKRCPRKPISTPPRKSERNPILHRTLFADEQEIGKG
jgi:hypothetical protein